AISAAERSNIVREFQDPKRLGQFDLLLLSPKAAGVGLTLTAANHVIHLSRWWNPAVEDQCTDRTYRIGQTKPVTVHIPRAIHPAYGHGSFDCVLHELLERKRSLSRDMLIPMDAGNEIDEIYKGLNDE
ncbi:MAG: C-terminal helicase domain-containing protein, partial [Glaciecola sp.]